jgi:capsule polysaccharide export protein KpsE/RkpR
MPDEDVVPITVIPAVSPQAAQQEEEEIDFTAEMVARESIEREEQHEEVMEVLSECQNQLEKLTALSLTLSESQTAESPIMMDLSRQIAEIKAQVESLTQEIKSMVSQVSSQEESSSRKTEHQISDSTAMDDGSTHVSTGGPEESEEPSRQEPPAPGQQKRRRFRKL